MWIWRTSIIFNIFKLPEMLDEKVGVCVWEIGWGLRERERERVFPVFHSGHELNCVPSVDVYFYIFKNNDTV